MALSIRGMVLAVVMLALAAVAQAGMVIGPGYKNTFTGTVPRGTTKDPGCNKKTVASGGLGVYYSFTPSVGVTCSLDTCNTMSFETYIEVYQAKTSGGYNHCVANVDMGCNNGNLNGSLQYGVNMAGNTTYTVAVLANAPGDGGPFTMTMSCNGCSGCSSSAKGKGHHHPSAGHKKGKQNKTGAKGGGHHPGGVGHHHKG